MSCPGSPRRVATIARPQASFSKAGLYMPCFAGKPARARSIEAIATVLMVKLIWDDVGPVISR